jgi:hypothetical protein
MTNEIGEIDKSAAAAGYLASMAAELSVIARHHGLRTLSYILDMARLEAESAHRSLNGGNNPGGHKPFNATD